MTDTINHPDPHVQKVAAALADAAHAGGLSDAYYRSADDALEALVCQFEEERRRYEEREAAEDEPCVWLFVQDADGREVNHWKAGGGWERCPKPGEGDPPWKPGDPVPVQSEGWSALSAHLSPDDCRTLIAALRAHVDETVGPVPAEGLYAEVARLWLSDAVEHDRVTSDDLAALLYEVDARARRQLAEERDALRAVVDAAVWLYRGAPHLVSPAMREALERGGFVPDYGSVREGDDS